MFPYIVIVIYCLIGIFLFDLSNRLRYRTSFYIGLSVLMTLIIGLRFEVGGDTLNYMGDYIWRKPLSRWEFTFVDMFQPGYTFLCAVGKSVSNEFYVFQLIHATILNICLFVFIWKNTKYIFTSILLIFISYYLYFSTEILREILAVMVFILNYKAFQDRKWIKYYLGVALACLFHISAIFLFLLPILKFIKCNVYFLLIFAVAFIFFLFTKNILSALSSFELISSKINYYIDQDSHGMLADLLELFRLSVFPIIYCYFSKLFSKKKILFEQMILIMSLFGLGSFFNPIIFSRASNYFLIPFVVSISQYLIECYKSKKPILHQYFFVVCFIFIFFYGGQNLMYRKYQRWIPYYSIYNPVSVNRDNYGGN